MDLAEIITNSITTVERINLKKTDLLKESLLPRKTNEICNDIYVLFKLPILRWRHIRIGKYLLNNNFAEY